MSQASLLDVKITIKAEDELLNKIYDQIACFGSDVSEVDNVLSGALKQHIAGLGLSGDFEVEFHCGEVQKAWQGSGLNAQEWLETNVPPEDLTEPQASTPEAFAD